MLRKLPLLVLPLMLAACASAPAPVARLGLKLPPAALGESISLQQHLTVVRGKRTNELDAALEVDPGRVEVVGLALGQRVLTVSYDGKKMTSWRHLMLPKEVRAEDVLEDIQLCLWPVDAVAGALPPGWRITENGRRRTLYLNDAVVATVDYSASPRWAGPITLDNLRYQYRLTILSAP